MLATDKFKNIKKIPKNTLGVAKKNFGPGAGVPDYQNSSV